MASKGNNNRETGHAAIFKQEVTRLRKEFDAKISNILEHIRTRKLKEIKGKIQK